MNHPLPRPFMLSHASHSKAKSCAGISSRIGVGLRQQHLAAKFDCRWSAVRIYSDAKLRDRHIGDSYLSDALSCFYFDGLSPKTGTDTAMYCRPPIGKRSIVFCDAHVEKKMSSELFDTSDEQTFQPAALPTRVNSEATRWRT
jgi:hypothetical protein